MLKITVFSKKCETKDGKKFYKNVAKLTKKDGTEIYVDVMLPEDDKLKADEYPIIIEVDKANANLSTKRGTTEDGKTYERHTLWIKKYTKSKDKYVDTSLDEF